VSENFDIEEEVSSEETLRLFADIIDGGTFAVTLTSEFLRDLAEEIESLRENK
jgi:hypothetical protein